jgi:hypothetical protein
MSPRTTREKKLQNRNARLAVVYQPNTKEVSVELNPEAEQTFRNQDDQ